jgi:hypothetical protein
MHQPYEYDSSKRWLSNIEKKNIQRISGPSDKKRQQNRKKR